MLDTNYSRKNSQWILAIMTRTGSSGSNRIGEDRIFTVAGEIVVLGHRLGKVRESHEERRGESLWVQLQYSESTKSLPAE